MEIKLSHPLYYNPEYNCLHQLIEVKKNYIIITGECSYVDDTETTIEICKVKPSYLKKLILIQPEDISKSEHLYICENIGHLRVHRHIEDKSFLFYKDKNVIGITHK